jgi:hypothetical protein
VRRQRQHGARERRVEVAVLDPAVAGQDEITDQTRRRRRRLADAQHDLVAGVHDHIAIVDAGEQLADVAEARVIALEIAPARRGAGEHVARPLRRAGRRLARLE